jgi:hypothetical protein
MMKLPWRVKQIVLPRIGLAADARAPCERLGRTDHSSLVNNQRPTIKIAAVTQSCGFDGIFEK